MSGLDALGKAVSDLTGAVSSNTAELSALVAQIKNGVAGDDDASVQAAADKIEAIVANLNTATQAATAAVTPPAPPAPPAA